MLRLRELLWASWMVHRKARVKKAPSEVPDFDRTFKIYGAMVMTFTLKAIGLSDDILSPAQSQAILKDAARAFYLLDTRQQSAPKVSEEDESFIRIWQRYLPPDPRMKGNSSDDSGSFFLLGVTERMRERTTTAHSDLAYALLGAVRQAYDLGIKNFVSLKIRAGLPLIELRSSSKNTPTGPKTWAS